MPSNIQSYNCKNYWLPSYEVHVLNNLPLDSTDSLVTMSWGTIFLRWEMISDRDSPDYCVHDGVYFVPKGTRNCIWDVKYDGIYLGYFDGDKVYSQKYAVW
ncbi:hypothetical protein H5410_048826 [Solanum commersonii]|uniref:S-protein homolog n=1 Tax=Solanum commersonii TaxID=4109 RepID=A0A9J5XMV2_SOLCO|nr:hypothetical protein H5410_048826 [Solanum commersonii]